MDDDMNDGGTSGGIRDKLVATKQRWAQEGRLITGRPSHREEDRLPPGQRKTTDWPVLDLGVKPNIPLESWRLQIDGLVEQPMRLDWAQFQALPQTDFTSDIHCVTAWSKLDTAWEGVMIDDILADAGIEAPTPYTLAHSYDGYSTNVPLADLAAGKGMVALKFEGKPITPDHGGPARLLVPHLYFWKSAKWVNGLQFTQRDEPGFWELRGYHIYGDPWKEQRYTND